MKRFTLGAVAALAVLGLYACSGDTTTTENVISCQPKYWNSTTPVQPPCTVPVSITVDDTANHAYLAGEIQWKGNFRYDEVTRLAFYDASWNSGDGPFAPLYDDGPWDQGGHEAIGEVAGDHKFGAVVFVKPPSAAGTNTTISYGLQDNVYQTKYGNGWNWPKSSNGSFVVFAGQTADVKADGAVLPAFGTVDFKLTLDTLALTPPDGGGTWSTNTVKVKGTATTWAEVNVTASGNVGVYTMVLSDQVGAGKTFYHSGLLKSGDKPEWVWVLNGVEYKAAGKAAVGGVAAYTKATGGAFVAANVLIAGNNNTYITVP